MSVSTASYSPLFPPKRAKTAGLVRNFRRVLLSLTLCVVSLTILVLNWKRWASENPWASYNNTKPISAEPREAYATLLSTRPSSPDSIDHYFLSTRLLIHRLRHDAQTRTTLSRDIIILVTPSVSEAKRRILTLDGAIVKEVPRIYPSALHKLGKPKPQWMDCWTKLHLWNFTSYDSIFYIDGDILPLRNLDPLFTTISRQRFNQPPNYFDFAAPLDMLPNRRHLPTFNAGMMLFRPSSERLMSFLRWANNITQYDTSFMEQGFLNYYYGDHYVKFAAEVSGNWVRDLKLLEEEGLWTVHEKYWLLKEDGKEGQVRRLFEEGIRGLRKYTREELDRAVV
ncbi:hypothetical protein HK097_010902 [Rhizophlyctis rosea]|uniref:Glycosyltransferase family 8 protein n=1 Tax=Rhizophlyctis rosea TaxID=64517 RepID=A0AAD5S725_9FUNG|nr:hypothetical protein HK097_010902 [Rhizophlyctis rosea]